MGNRVALIVANDTYSDERLAQLRSPAADATELKRVLLDPEIGDFRSVEIATNQESHKLERTLEAFFKRANGDDLLLVHFSCHGVLDDEDALYFACLDTELDLVESTGVEAAKVNRYMTRSPSKQIVLLLDCCYAGAFAKGTAARGAKSVPVNEYFEGRGRCVITASRSTQSAYEKGGQGLTTEIEPSFFTAGIVQGLETGKAARGTSEWISVEDLYHYVEAYLEEQKSPQKPGRKLNGEGDLRIAWSPRGSLGRRPRRGDALDYSQLEPMLELNADNELFSIAISPDCCTVVAGTEKDVLVWTAETPIASWDPSMPPTPRRLRLAEDPDQLLHDSYVYSVSYSAHGDLVASSDGVGRVRVTSLDGRVLLDDSDSHTKEVYSVAFAPNGRYVASGGWDGRVLVWDLRTKAPRKRLERLAHISSVAFSPAADEDLLAIGKLDNTVSLWEFERQKAPVALPAGHLSSVEAVAFSQPDGALLATCGLDKTVRLWDVRERKEVWGDPGTHDYLVRAVAFSPDGRTIVSASWDKTMKLWDATAASGIATELPTRAGWEHDDWIWSVAFSDDGSLLASAGSDGRIIVWALPEAR